MVDLGHSPGNRGENPPPESLFLGPINLEPWLEGPELEAFPGELADVHKIIN